LAKIFLLVIMLFPPYFKEDLVSYKNLDGAIKHLNTYEIEEKNLSYKRALKVVKKDLLDLKGGLLWI